MSKRMKIILISIVCAVAALVVFVLVGTECNDGTDVGDTDVPIACEP